MIKDELKGKVSVKNFFEYAADLKEFKDLSQAGGSRANYNKEINRLKEFSCASLPMSSIDTTFLRKYESSERSRGMGQNTLNTTFLNGFALLLRMRTKKV